MNSDQKSLECIKPNLFEFATKELSQDAFLCWLISWANPAVKNHDQALHECGRAFLNSLFEAAKEQAPNEIVRLKVHRQNDHIDLWVEIDEGEKKTIILIEDKVGTGNHSDQLKNYKTKLTNRFQEARLICIYFKTFDQSNFEAIHEAGYHTFNRTMLLKTLEPYRDLSNAILQDFIGRMSNVEQWVATFNSTCLGEWDHLHWVGLYQALQASEKFPKLNWGRVNNFAGGYWGCWWPLGGTNTTDQVSEVPVYFQLRQNKAFICVSAKGEKSEWKSQQLNLHNQAISHARTLNLPLARPRVLKKGQNMTVAILAENGEYLVDDGNGLVDLEKTINFLLQFYRLNTVVWQK